MRTLTSALSKTQKLALGLCAAVASAVIALGSVGASPATIGAGLHESPELAMIVVKPTPEKPPVMRS
jgi:hypothetical protein